LTNTGFRGFGTKSNQFDANQVGVGSRVRGLGFANKGYGVLGFGWFVLCRCRHKGFEGVFRQVSGGLVVKGGGKVGLKGFRCLGCAKTKLEEPVCWQSDQGTSRSRVSDQEQVKERILAEGMSEEQAAI